MIDRIRHAWATLLTWARLSPPDGHMKMLRAEVGRRDTIRLGREAEAASKRRPATATVLPDVAD